MVVVLSQSGGQTNTTSCMVPSAAGYTHFSRATDQPASDCDFGIGTPLAARTASASADVVAVAVEEEVGVPIATAELRRRERCGTGEAVVAVAAAVDPMNESSVSRRRAAAAGDSTCFMRRILVADVGAVGGWSEETGALLGLEPDSMVVGSSVVWCGVVWCGVVSVVWFGSRE